jgi:lipopolysaccharide assembly outer membrane protein LptD (OstA)
MKLAVSSLILLGFAGAGFSRADKVPADEIQMSAVSQTSDGHLRTLQGQVRIETSSVTIRADKAVVDTDSMDVEATGNVHITLKK